MADLILTIGNKNYSSWSLRGWLATKASGLEFDEKLIRLFEDGHTETMGAETPAGKVPVLRHGNKIIWESLAIAEYVAELAPERNLWPADSGQRAHARSISAEMATGFFGLRGEFPMNIRRKVDERTPSAEAAKDIRRIQEIWTQCRAVAGNGPYLFGDFTIADVMYAPVVFRFEGYGIEVDEISRAYMDAMLANEWVKEWVAEALKEPWTIDEDEV
ncbi:MAG: glutathione S-transferase family protein [Rhodospirillales bacterium]|nr:glutathione S-transferase family protein [Rhodospirillales bacterium]